MPYRDNAKRRRTRRAWYARNREKMKAYHLAWCRRRGVKPRDLDLTGRQFGLLTVISRHPQKANNGKSRWICQCKCGGTNVVEVSSLTCGHTKSCGCFSIAAKRKPGSAFRRIFMSYVHDARKAGHEFLLTEQQAKIYFEAFCSYCGQPPSTIQKSRTETYVFTGVDRLDSSKGYSVGNCVPCCKTCNRMKMDMGYEEFMAHIQRILEHRIFVAVA
jgi:hypothetical protein